MACLAAWTGPVHPNPQGVAVVNGQASLSRPDPRTLTVTNSAGAILNWNSFSIQPGEVTRFNQPSTSSAVLNRVVGRDPSGLFGTLQSNGRVFLINPNGIVFGQGSVIDTAGLVASTLNMSNADFLTGRMRFDAGDVAGGIVNQGVLRAGENGQIILIAPDIRNEGVIETRNGSILLAAGRRVELSGPGLEDVRFDIQAPADRVVNLGQIDARGGVIKAFAGTLKNSGIVRANSLERNDRGEIVLAAKRDIELTATSRVEANGNGGGRILVESESGITNASGVIEARGSRGDGGSVSLLGQGIRLLGNANIDASGATGGGTVLIGGDYQGKNPEVRNAAHTYFGPDATVEADAGMAGNGGKVVVWADETTQFYGRISARGGSSGGDGGFVETSGKRWLDFQGNVDTRAPFGNSGTLLLDPTDILISDSAPPATPTFGGACGATTFCDTTTAPAPPITLSTLAASRLTGQLAQTNVIITTASSQSAAGDITIEAPISYSSKASLTLLADRNVLIGGPIVNSKDGDLTITASAGGVDIRGDISTGGGMILIKGFAGVSALKGTLIDAGTGTIAIVSANSPIDLHTSTLQTSSSSGVAISVQSAGTLALGNVILTGGGTLELRHDGSGSQNAGATISGTGNLLKEGAGAFTLSQHNTYSGTTTIEEGVLVLSGTDSLPATTAMNVTAGTTLELLTNQTVASLTGGDNRHVNDSHVKLNANTLTIGDSTSTTFAGVIDGSGTLVKQGTGTLTLTAGNSYTGGTSINVGRLLVSGADSRLGSGAVTVADGATLQLTEASLSNVLTLNGSGSPGSPVALAAQNSTLTGATTLASDTAIIVTGNVSMKGPITGPGSLSTVGSLGNLALSGNNTYEGGTNITGAKVIVSGGAAIPDTSAVTLSPSGQLELASDETIGALTGAAGSHVILNSSTLTAGTSTSTTFAGTISGASASGLTKQGSGTLTLSGTDTYTGPTNITEGTLVLAGGHAIADSAAVIVHDGATLQLANDETIGSLSGTSAANLFLGGNTLTTGDSTSPTFAGIINSGGGLTKQGSGIMTFGEKDQDASVGPLALTVKQGTLQLGGDNLLPDSTDVVVNNRATLDLTQFSDTVRTATSQPNGTILGDLSTTGAWVNAGRLLLSHNRSFGQFSNSGTIEIQSGTLSIGGGYVQNGGSTRVDSGARLVMRGGNPLTVNAGTLSGGGTIVGDVVNNGGTVAPGSSPGTLNITGNYVQSPSGILNIELAGTNQGVTYDLINISGSASLAGTLNVVLSGGFVPVSGTTFDIMTYGSVTGNFATITGLTGLFFQGTPSSTFYQLGTSVADTTQSVLPASCP